MDICGHYPTSERGNKYILVITDHFTKWVEAYPIQNQEAVTVGFCFESFVNTFGYPDIMLTDQGRNFESELIKEMCARLKIDKRTTSAYHPQCNGQTERFNRTMNSMLAQYVGTSQTDWDQWLPSVLFAYRTAVHESTGFSPYQLLFGRDPKQPIDFSIPAPLSQTVPAFNHSYFSALKRSMESIRDQARSNLRHAQSKQKAYHDQSVTADQLAIGDLAFVYNPVMRGSPKFQKHWEGPYLVVSRLAGGVTYKLRSTDGADKFLTVHRDRLKKCNSEPMQEQLIHHVESPIEPIPAALELPQIFEEHAEQRLNQHADQAVAVQLEQLAPAPVAPDAPPQLRRSLALEEEAAVHHDGEQPQPVVDLPAVQSARPKRDVRPPNRLVDEYAPALVAQRKGKKKN